MWTLWDALRWSTCILLLLICFALLLYSNIVVTCTGHPAGIYSFWVTYCRFLYCVWRNLSVDCCGIYSTNNTIKWYGVHLSVPMINSQYVAVTCCWLPQPGCRWQISINICCQQQSAAADRQHQYVEIWGMKINTDLLTSNTRPRNSTKAY